MQTVAGAERFSSAIALAPVVDAPRAPDAQAFSASFMMAARDVYPRHGFATVDSADYGATLPLG